MAKRKPPKHFIWKNVDKWTKEDCLHFYKGVMALGIDRGSISNCKVMGRFPPHDVLDVCCYLFRVTPYQLLTEEPIKREDRCNIGFPDTYNLFFDNLERYCEENEMTLDDLSAALGSQQMFSMKRARHRKFTYDMVLQILDFFDIDLRDLYAEYPVKERELHD